MSAPPPIADIDQLLGNAEADIIKNVSINPAVCELASAR
jgi:hypothetical protein